MTYNKFDKIANWDCDRYLAIVDWARARYTHNGWLVTYQGNRPSKYTIIEVLAASKYLGIK